MARTTPRRLMPLLVATVTLASVAGCSSSSSDSSADKKAGDSTTTVSKGATSTTGGSGPVTAGDGSGPTTTTGGGGGSTTTAGGGGGSTTTAGGGAGSTSTGGGKGSSTTVGDPGGNKTGSCVNDSERLSGSSTVIWTADSKAEHQGSEATAKTTLLIQSDGSLDPAKLTVKVGQVFTFGLADGVNDVAAVKVGCDSGQTVYSGEALASEYITAPGTYEVVNDIESKTVGTITVTP